MKVLGIVGSLRRRSINRSLLQAAIELAPPGMSIETHDLAGLPFYNQDLEEGGLPEAVQAFQASIRGSDGLLIVTPEYNYGIPGVLKNALDWASRTPRTTPLRGLPAAVLGASAGGSGTIRAQIQVRQCLLATDTLAMSQPEVRITQAPEKFDEEGRLTDEGTRKVLTGFLLAFQAWIARLRGA